MGRTVRFSFMTLVYAFFVFTNHRIDRQLV